MSLIQEFEFNGEIMKAKNETSPAYIVDNSISGDAAGDAIIRDAIAILELRLYRGNTDIMNSPNACREFLQMKMCQLEHEVFSVVFLDAQHRAIKYEEMFTGTLTQTSVYPREVVKRALHHNAAAVIFAHNHPSGVSEPSQSDRMLTDALKQALALVDVRVLDYFIVAGMSPILSFAERGMI
jgi:DNA repair protein RadC